MSAAGKDSVRYRNSTEPEILAHFPDGERFRLPLEKGMANADVSGPHHLFSLRKLSSMLRHEDRVLELGSGDGFSAFFLAHQVRELISQDWRGEWQRYASKRYRLPNLKFVAGPVALGLPNCLSALGGTFDRIILFNPIGRGIEKKRIWELISLVETQYGNELPLFWSEQLDRGERNRSALLEAEMRECMGPDRMERFRFQCSADELMIWPASWSVQCRPDDNSPLVQPELMERILDRSGGCMVFGSGIPKSWPRDFLLADNGRRYGVLSPDCNEIEFLSAGRGAAQLSMEQCDLFFGAGCVQESPLIQSHNPRSLWIYASGEFWREQMQEQIRFHMKKGQIAEGYVFSDDRGMLLRVDLCDRLPLFPILDTTLAVPDWSFVTAYLEWTKRKAMMTLTPQVWSEMAAGLGKQAHRGLLLLVGFSDDHVDLIKTMSQQGWRIGLGANQPIDQVPLQSFEKFRLLLENQGIPIDALWMGERPPDPAYMKNIHSRFKRLLISTQSIQKSWDSKKVRFCLTLKPGDNIQAVIYRAYSQMAGLEELKDFQMLYHWASALEKAGSRQAAKAIFNSLSRSRVPEVLDPGRQKAGVYLHLGRIAEAESDLNRATRYYEHSLNLFPEFHDAAEKLAKLKRSGLTT